MCQNNVVMAIMRPVTGNQMLDANGPDRQDSFKVENDTGTYFPARPPRAAKATTLQR